MSTTRTTPVDQLVRDRLQREFDKNFLVEAGAGSGKTHSLATRMAAGIAAGVYTVEHMAVVTFTRKAAAELRGRFQLALEERLRAGPPNPERARLEAGLAGMERLVAGTIHSFCARLLRERPVDAHIAPGFVELGDLDDAERRKRAWRDFVAMEAANGFKPLLDLVEAGIKPADLDAAFAAVCEHEDVEFDMGSGDPPDATPYWAAIDDFWAHLVARRPPEFHENTTCGVQVRFEEFDGRLRNARRERLASLAAFLDAWGKPRVTQKYWDKEVGGAAGTGKQVKDLVDRFHQEVVEPFLVPWHAYVHRLAMAVLIKARQFYAAERRRQNVVNYVDLLRVTADMLRHSASVRRAMQQKYRFLFIDEFQDTDPIQAEIFLMLGAAELGSERCEVRGADAGGDAPGSPLDPYALPLGAGRLFVVGDPKQSIFRFRRADIDIYNRVASRIKETGGEVVTLTANFRSLPSVCAVANAVFPQLFADRALPYSPPFARLDPVREEPGSGVPTVAVMTVPAEEDGVKPEAKEAGRIAAWIRAEVDGGRRTYGDFLVLTRQTTRLTVFADAFDALRVPVDVSGAGLFCKSLEVQVLAGLLQALADPLDSVALVGVLRGRLFGHSDPELFAFRQAGGRFELSPRLPDPGDEAQRAALDARYGPVLQSMRSLRAMWQDTRRMPLPAAIDRILDDTGWLALSVTTPGGARAGHLLQAVDRVREVVEEGGGLAEAADALNEEERVSDAEAMPLEPGRRNVVRLMNLHKGKGLEASVVVLADATHQYPFPVTQRIERRAGATAIGHLKIVRPSEQPWMGKLLGQSADWDAHAEEEKKYAEAERLRLLYVAGTRARDLLVLCRNADPKKNKAWDVFCEYFADAPELTVPGTPPAGANPIAGMGKPAPSPAGVARQLRVEAALRDQRHERIQRPSWDVTSVTADTVQGSPRKAHAGAADPASGAQPGAAEQPRADAGVAWGSLVHGLLEHAMRHPAASASDLDRLARWLTIEAPELRPEIRKALGLVEAMRKSDAWKQAREGREVHVEAPFAVRLDASKGHAGHASAAAGPLVLRGVIDLVYRADDGWHIVDYKTDLGADEFELRERYRGQLKRYQLAWEDVTGQPVVETRTVSAR